MKEFIEKSNEILLHPVILMINVALQFWGLLLLTHSFLDAVYLHYCISTLEFSTLLFLNSELREDKKVCDVLMIVILLSLIGIYIYVKFIH